MDFITSVRRCLQKFNIAKGRASRSEFWWFVLFGAFVGTGTMMLDYWLFSIALDDMQTFGLNRVSSIILLVPSIAVLLRRFHDAGYAGSYAAGCFLFTLFIAIMWPLYNINEVVIHFYLHAAQYISFFNIHAVAFAAGICIGLLKYILSIGVWLYFLCKKSCPEPNEWGVPQKWEDEGMFVPIEKPFKHDPRNYIE